MFKSLLFVFALFFTCSLVAQQPGGTFTKPNNSRGITYNGMRAEFEFYPPVKDTNWTPAYYGALTIRPQDSAARNGIFYTWVRTKWLPIQGGGSGGSITVPSGRGFLIGYDGNATLLPGFTIDTTGKLIQSTDGYAWGLGHVVVASLQSSGYTRSAPIWPGSRADSGYNVTEAMLYRILNTFGFSGDFYSSNGTFTSNRQVRYLRSCT